MNCTDTGTSRPGLGRPANLQRSHFMAPGSAVISARPLVSAEWRNACSSRTGAGRFANAAPKTRSKGVASLMRQAFAAPVLLSNDTNLGPDPSERDQQPDQNQTVEHAEDEGVPHPPEQLAVHQQVRDL